MSVAIFGALRKKYPLPAPTTAPTGAREREALYFFFPISSAIASFGVTTSSYSTSL
jgi:hypothetical protein